MKKTMSIYAVFIGFCMIGMWIMFYLTDSIPEIKTRPIELMMHVIAEFLTAILLIISGVGILMHKKWANKLYLFASGMLVYTLIMSPGYFLEKGEYPIAIMFAAFLVIIIVFIFYLFKDKKNQ